MSDVCHPTLWGFTEIIPLVYITLEFRGEKIPLEFQQKLNDTNFLSEVLKTNSAPELFSSLLKYIDHDVTQDELLKILNSVLNKNILINSANKKNDG